MQAGASSFNSLFPIQRPVLCLTQHELRKYLLNEFTNEPRAVQALLVNPSEKL